MSHQRQVSTEVQPRPARRRFTATYKRQIVAQAEQCQHGELGALLRREGLTYKQIGQWRKAAADGTLDARRGPLANPNRAELRHLQAENERLRRKLSDAEAIIDAQKKLAALLDRLNEEDGT